MEKKKLTLKQTLVRIIFMIAAIALVTYFFPHSESFKYEYELGKPWRYGRLSAPYDFPIYRSDSIIKMMEDSIRMQLVPRLVLDSEVSNKNLTASNRAKNYLSVEAYNKLRRELENYYEVGIVSEADKDILMKFSTQEAYIRTENRSRAVPINQIKSEKDVYTELTNDSVFGRQFLHAKIRDYIGVSLSPDTTAMTHEYARLRQEVSSTSGVVLAESRIVDQGEIVTPEIYSKLESYRKEHELRRDTSSDESLMLIGRIILISIVLCSILLFMRLYRPWLYLRQAETLVAIGSVTIMTVLTALASRVIVGGAYLVPIGIVTIVLATFLGSRTAYYCHIVMALLCSFMAPSHFEYLMLQCIVGMIIIFNLKDGLNERSQLMRVCLITGLSYCVLYSAYTLANEGTLVNMSLVIIVMMLCNALMLLMSYLIIYAMEKVFHFMSGVTLVELCNLNSKLLMRLSKEAPGTFHHSMQVSNLAANAAKEIEANVQLVRTGALYHDIGKLWAPVYYTENQMGASPHNGISIEKSVEIIKKHVSEGLRLAEQAKLPQEITDFIVTHHGKGKIKYFYNTWCNQHPEENPDEEFFSYEGPDPTTKEQAILMLGDSVEAAAKSIKEPDEKSIKDLVEKMVNDIVSSGRLNNAKITLQEIQKVKKSFIKDLLAIYHSRIAYPELNKKG